MQLDSKFLRYLACASLCSLIWAQKTPSADAVFALALAKLKSSNFVVADAGFRKIIELEPEGLRGYSGVAQVLIAQARMDEAVAYLLAASTERPTRFDLRVLAGDTAVRAGKYDLAIAEFKAVLSQADPVLVAEIKVPRGSGGPTMSHSRSVSPEAESLAILTVRDGTPKGAVGLHVRLAEVYRLKKEYATAVREWELVDKALPKQGWVLGNIGSEKESAGDNAGAVTTYREALALSPNNPEILNNLAFSLAETGGDLYEALRYARRADILAPGLPDIADTQGWIALKQGNLDDAIGTFLRVVLREPGRVDFRKHLAEALIKKGVHSLDIDELVKALKAPPVDGDESLILLLIDKTEKK